MSPVERHRAAFMSEWVTLFWSPTEQSANRLLGEYRDKAKGIKGWWTDQLFRVVPPGMV